MAIPWRYERDTASCLGRLSLYRPMGHYIDPSLHLPDCCAVVRHHTNWCLKCRCENANRYLDEQIAWETELFNRWYRQLPWWARAFRKREKVIHDKLMWAMNDSRHMRHSKYEPETAPA